MISIAPIDYSNQIVFLHYQTIDQGFLPKLGPSFLQSLYRFLIKKELVLVYKENDMVLGFVSCALSSQGIMKRFLVSSPAGVLKIGWAVLKKPALLKPLWETFRAPSLSVSENKNEPSIPETELLSISVSPQAQQGGIGTKLLAALEKELVNRGITSYKVIAGKKLEGANKFYRKNGFVLVRQITIHGNEVSNVYVKNIKSKNSYNIHTTT
jgi:ribosomal protein S18 acetylase RimI-like enzyme